MPQSIEPHDISFKSIKLLTFFVQLKRCDGGMQCVLCLLSVPSRKVVKVVLWWMQKREQDYRHGVREILESLADTDIMGGSDCPVLHWSQ